MSDFMCNFTRWCLGRMKNKCLFFNKFKIPMKWDFVLQIILVLTILLLFCSALSHCSFCKYSGTAFSVPEQFGWYATQHITTESMGLNKTCDSHFASPGIFSSFFQIQDTQMTIGFHLCLALYCYQWMKHMSWTHTRVLSLRNSQDRQQ